jgi:hypothetical protein
MRRRRVGPGRPVRGLPAEGWGEPVARGDAGQAPAVERVRVSAANGYAKTIIEPWARALVAAA